MSVVNFIWNEESDAALRDVHATSGEIKFIASELSTRFDWAFSTNSIVGRLHRLGISTPRARPAPDHTWTDEDDAMVRDKRARGIAYGTIVRGMRARKARDVTIQFLRERMSEPRRKGGRAASPRFNKAQPKKRLGDTGRERALARRAQLPVLPLPPAFVEPDDLPRLTYAEHTQRHCKWPIGDPVQDWEGFRLCGHERLEGKPYCQHHTLRSVASSAA